jgi:hypothetical protein
MFTHSSRTTQVPAASPAAPTQKRKRNVLEQIPTPPPRRRAKTQRFASEEAQKAGASDVRARKKASAASKKTVKNITPSTCASCKMLRYILSPFYYHFTLLYADFVSRIVPIVFDRQ